MLELLDINNTLKQVIGEVARKYTSRRLYITPKKKLSKMVVQGRPYRLNMVIAQISAHEGHEEI